MSQCRAAHLVWGLFVCALGSCGGGESPLRPSEVQSPADAASREIEQAEPDAVAPPQDTLELGDVSEQFDETAWTPEVIDARADDVVDALELDLSDCTAADDGVELHDVCTPDCEGKECGEDGCGGDCGVCVGENDECIEGACVCVPHCGPAECGSDGCGGQCGQCQELEFCSDEGVCECEFITCFAFCCDDGEVCFSTGCCIPDCTADPCGSDGCGFPCKECLQDYDCAVVEDQAVCSPDCAALCAGQECGGAGLDGECDCGECDDGNPCTSGHCGEDNLCLFEPVDGFCDDGSVCSVTDLCIGGVCTGGAEVDCDDGLDCTLDVCSPTAGCHHKSACLDGEICGDTGECCVPALCGSAGYECGQFPNACGGSLDCGGCTEGETCASGVCTDGSCDAQTLSLFGGSALDVVAVGDYAYVAFGVAGLSIFDVSGEAPYLISNFPLPEHVRDVDLWSGYAFVSGHADALYIVDVSDPSQPLLVSTFETPWFAASGTPFWEVDVEDGWAYIVADDQGMITVDISQPENPVLGATVETAYHATNVAVYKGYAYVVDRATGLYIFDVGDPSNPALVSQVNPLPGNADWYDFVISAGYAFVLIEEDAFYNVDDEFKLAVFDLNDPIEPALKSYLTIDWFPFLPHLAVVGGTAYIASGASGVQLVDVADPENPQLLDVFDTAGEAIGVDSIPGKLLIADGAEGFVLVDAPGPQDLNSTGTYSTLGNVRSVAVEWPFAYVTEGEPGLQIVDLSDPGAPELAGSCQLGGKASHLGVEGDYAYVNVWGSSNSWVSVVDVSAPESPTVLGTALSEGIDVLRVSNSFVYAARGLPYYDFVILDASDPAAPILAGSAESDKKPLDMDVRGDFVYLLNYGTVFRVYDVSDPYLPVALTKVQVGGGSNLLAVGDYLYVVTNTWLEVFDIKVPPAPEWVGMIPMGNSVGSGYSNLFHDAGRLFLVGGWTGGVWNQVSVNLLVFDLSLPAAPQIVATTGLTNSNCCPYLQERYDLVPGLLVGGEDCGAIRVFDLSGCW